MTLPRPDHPRPRLARTAWRNLNGPWSFALAGDADLDAGPPDGSLYDRGDRKSVV